jgi:hypothetical protein
MGCSVGQSVSVSLVGFFEGTFVTGCCVCGFDDSIWDDVSLSKYEEPVSFDASRPGYSVGFSVKTMAVAVVLSTVGLKDGGLKRPLPSGCKVGNIGLSATGFEFVTGSVVGSFEGSFMIAFCLSLLVGLAVFRFSVGCLERLSINGFTVGCLEG